MNIAMAAQGAVIWDDRSTVGAPCSDCNDCDKSPCPMPLADCIQMHANPGPGLMAASVELRIGTSVIVLWSLAHTTLRGLSPPPDPLPPRA